jgi:hypothetical protein
MLGDGAFATLLTNYDQTVKGLGNHGYCTFFGIVHPSDRMGTGMMMVGTFGLYYEMTDGKIPAFAVA